MTLGSTWSVSEHRGLCPLTQITICHVESWGTLVSLDVRVHDVSQSPWCVNVSMMCQRVHDVPCATVSMMCQRVHDVSTCPWCVNVSMMCHAPPCPWCVNESMMCHRGPLWQICKVDPVHLVTCERSVNTGSKYVNVFEGTLFIRPKHKIEVLINN